MINDLGEKMVDVYTKYRNELDDILYLSFSSIEPFWFYFISISLAY